MKLYGYYLSQNTYRVRVVLNLKGVAYEDAIVNVRSDARPHRATAYLAINPQGKVPALDDDGIVVTQSLAILEYLEERFPWPPLLPADAAGRARVRSLSLALVADVFPLIQRRVRDFVAHSYDEDEPGLRDWCAHWVSEGLATVEAMLAPTASSSAFCHGDSLTIADACLSSALNVARRYDCDLSGFPILRRLRDVYRQIPAFHKAEAQNQPDAPPGFSGT